MSAAVEVPSGDAATQLGSGFTDFVVNSIGQKSLSDRIVVHANVGYQNKGNTLTGAIGIRTPGKIVSEGLSITMDVTPGLNLGADINGAQIRTAHRQDRQLQLTVGGTQALGAKTSLAFSMFTGWYESPQWGILAGMTWTP